MTAHPTTPADAGTTVRALSPDRVAKLFGHPVRRITVQRRHALLAEANQCQDRADYFRGRGDNVSADRQESKAAELRAAIRAATGEGV